MFTFHCEFPEGNMSEPDSIKCFDAASVERLQEFRTYFMRDTVYYSRDEILLQGKDAREASAQELLAGSARLLAALTMINTVEPTNLPAAEFFPILASVAEGDDQIVMVDNRNGLRFWRDENDTTIDYSLYDIRQYLDAGEIDDEISRQVMQDALETGYGKFGYTPQVLDQQSNILLEHYTIGNEDENGLFTPYVSVLNENHSVRRLQDD